MAHTPPTLDESIDVRDLAPGPAELLEAKEAVGGLEPPERNADDADDANADVDIGASTAPCDGHHNHRMGAETLEATPRKKKKKSVTVLPDQLLMAGAAGSGGPTDPRAPSTDGNRRSRLDAVVPEGAAPGGHVVYRTPDDRAPDDHDQLLRIPLGVDAVPGQPIVLAWPEKPLGCCAECWRPRCVSVRNCRRCCIAIGTVITSIGLILLGWCSWELYIAYRVLEKAQAEGSTAGGTIEPGQSLLLTALGSVIQNTFLSCWDAFMYQPASCSETRWLHSVAADRAACRNVTALSDSIAW